VHDTPAYDAHGAHSAHGDQDAHGAHSAHGDHAPTHGFLVKTDSPALLTVPIIILAFLALVSGYINAAPFKIEKFTEWVAPASGAFFPELAHATFKWVNALPSIVLVLAGFAVSLAVCKALYGERASALQGLTRRSRVMGGLYAFLWNKYYLDDLYEKGIVHAIAHPIAKAAYWTNQHILDAIVNGVGTGGKRTGQWVYRNIDQRVVDGAVNGSGTVARESGGALRPLQSGRINQYGALLFGAAAVGALVLVIVNT
jgi:NADH-quinone oxidoreductase subunit L